MRIVIKIGTSTLAYSTGRLNIRRVEQLCRTMSDLKNAGNEIILISSGAIGMGVGKLGLKSRPTDIPTKQAAAAVGQCELMYTYDKLFEEYNHTVAQILLTGEDIENEKRRENFRNTVFRLLSLGVLPIVNENDTVATDEIVIGDNDGLDTQRPHKFPAARLLSQVQELTPEIFALAGEKGSPLGTGGMRTKLRAAEISTNAGIDMIIANGADPLALYNIADGKAFGTKFVGKRRR